MNLRKIDKFRNKEYGVKNNKWFINEFITKNWKWDEIVL